MSVGDHHESTTAADHMVPVPLVNVRLIPRGDGQSVDGDVLGERCVTRPLGCDLAMVLPTVSADVDDLAIGEQGSAVEQCNRLGDTPSDVGLPAHPRPLFVFLRQKTAYEIRTTV